MGGAWGEPPSEESGEEERGPPNARKSVTYLPDSTCYLSPRTLTAARPFGAQLFPNLDALPEGDMIRDRFGGWLRRRVVPSRPFVSQTGNFDIVIRGRALPGAR